MKGLNLSTFKKISSDKKTTTLQHEDGHRITIMHGALPAIQRKALEKLPIHDAEGGEVRSGKQRIDFEKGVNADHGENSKSWSDTVSVRKQKTRAAHEANLEELKTMPKPKLAAGGEVGRGAVAGGEPPDTTRLEKITKLANGGEACRHCGGPIHMYEDGSNNQPVSKDDGKDEQSSEQQAPAPVVVNVHNGPQPDAPQPTAMSASAPAALQYPPVPEAKQETPVLQQPLPYGQQNGISGVAQDSTNAVKNEQQAIDNEAVLKRKMTEAAATQARGKIIADQTFAQTVAHTLEHQTNTVNAFAKEMQDINPNSFTHNMGGGQKVATAIGLLLGGFSGGFNGTGKNPAMEWLDKNIDRDIAAQVANNDKRKTIYGAYLQLYGDQNIAAKLARATEYDRLAHQVDLQAGNLGGAGADAAAQAAKAKLQQEKNQLLIDSAYLGATNHTRGASLPAAPSGAQNTSGSAEPKVPDMRDSSKKITEPFRAQTPEPILKPNSAKMIAQAVQYHPLFKNAASGAKLSDQHTQAYQADQALKELAPTFNSLQDEANALQKLGSGIPHVAGGLGALIAGAMSKSVGGAGGGGAAGEAIGQALSPYLKDDKTRRFAAHVQDLTGYISSALQGRGDNFVRDAIEKYTPDFQDEPATRKAKFDGLVKYIKTHVNHDMLDAADATRHKQQ